MKRILLIFVVCFSLSAFSQIINSSFIAPDTVCVNQTFTIQNTSTGSINSTYWNFCTSSVALTQSVNLGASASSFPVFMSINNDAGTYYAFVSHNSPGGMSRFNFGNNLNNIPTSTNLGNFGGQMPGNSEGIVIEQEGSNWYGVVVGGPVGTIARMNFGTSLANLPTVVNMGNIGTLSYPHRLKVIHSGGNKYGFTVNRNNNTVTRFDFGNSLNNVPVGTNLGNLGGLSGPNDFDIVYVNGNWHMFITNDGNNTLVRWDFGNSLLNTPTGTNLGTIGVGNLRGISIDITCGGIRGQVTSQNNPYYNLNFPSGPTGIPTTAFVGNTPFAFPHSLEKYRINDTVYTFVPNPNSNSLTRVKYASCKIAAIPNTTLTNPAPITFTAPGIYTISILNNSNQYNQSVYCKTIAVVNASVINVSPNPGIICLNNTITLTASGSSNYTWTPIGGLTSTNTPTTQASPSVTTVYTVVGQNTLGCNGFATITVQVLPLPTVVVTQPSQTICLNSSTILTATGAVTYTWSPGNLTGSSVTVSPLSNIIYTVLATAGTCTGSATASIDVVAGPTVIANSSSLNICSGNSIILSSSGASSYTWNPGNVVGGTVTVFPPAGTIVYTVSGQSANGCVDTAVVSVTVTATPTLTILPATPTLCLGNTIWIGAIGATNYTWTPTNFTTSNIQIMPIITTTYTVLGANGTCTNTATTTVQVLPNPTITAVASPSVKCIGGSSTLTASGGISYTWSPPWGLSWINGSFVISNFNGNICYYVTGYNSFGCAATASVCISSTPTSQTFNANVTPSVMCSGSSCTILPTGALNYTFSPPLTLFTNSLVISPTVGMVYSITGQFTNGCITTQTVFVDVGQTPTVNINSIPGVICIGDMGSLEGSGATSYTWLPSSSNNTNIIVTPTTTTTYTLLGQVGTCTGSVVATVTVNPYPNLATLVFSPTLCLGRSTDIFASGANTYTWQPGNAFGFSVNVSPTVSTVYTVSGTSLNCSVTRTVDVTVVPNPYISIFVSPAVTCLDPLVGATLTASGANTFTWLPNSSTSQSISVSPSAATSYTASGTDSNGCISSSTIGLSVHPNLYKSMSDTLICEGRSLNLMASGASSYLWMPGSFNQASIRVSPNVSTIYTVIATNGLCSKTGTVNVEVIEDPIHDIPEVFTPNDDGKNDRFVIKSETLTKIDLKVFNRWGTLVYAHSEYDNTWDGTANSGTVFGNNKLPQGTYYYVIDLESCDKQVIRGYVVIQY